MSNIVFNFEALYNIMRECVQREICPDGLLEDVETFVPSYDTESRVEEPVVWMTQHPSRAEKQADISRTMDIITPFQFTCAVYKPDIEDAELASQNLATRVILCITRNLLSVQNELYGKRFITTIGLETYYPVGEVNIVNKSEKLPATGVVLNVTHRINWELCCKKINEEN